ncbi:CSRN3 protein, partial [Amia calva]|nr:CSRN3 protein [Amia calva]
MSGTLKRKFNEVEEDQCYSSSSPSSLSSSTSSGWDSDGESCYSDTLDSRPSNPNSPAANFPITSILKRTKREHKGTVHFDHVTVFFFPRCQGFTSVPSRGGCTLGMVKQHSLCRQYTLAEFALEQQHLRREKLKYRLKEEKLEALKLKLTKNGTRESEEADQLTVDDISEDDIDISGVDLEDGFFLHPYPSKRRHSLLKTAGVKKIDKEEKRELHSIRLSREDCGCDCQGFCEPETCGCSLAGIKCQMDHSSFPCGCTKDGCGNTEGRIEFNSSRVQTHYIHTIMKLELEKRLEESPDTGDQVGRLLPQPEENRFGFPREEDRTVPASPTFHFNTELDPVGENSCSSDMTDSSSFSCQSEDSEGPCGGNSPQSDKPHQQQPVGFGYFSATDFFNDNMADEAPPRVSADDQNRNHVDNRRSSISDLLDENANQDTTLFQNSNSIPPFPNTPSPSVDHSSKSYMDLSLSSDSDLEFFDGFPGYSPSPLYNSLKEYENLDNFYQFQLPSYPSFPQASDPGTCFLESLIGLSESVPEPPATFTDNQLLEEAIKSSMMESVKV